MERPDRRLRLVVLMGGQSPEHDVSLSTGAQVVGALDRASYEVRPVVIGRDGGWTVPDGWDGPIPDGGAETSLSAGVALERLREDAPDALFLALHGPFGEDGTVQGLLDLAGLRYTGSGVLGSALAMDKQRSRWVLERHGLAVPRTEGVSRREWARDPRAVTKRLHASLPPMPWFVKPPDQGSSVGIHRVEDAGALAPALEDALSYSRRALVEEFLEGGEAACGVLDGLDGEPPLALPPTEIVPRTASWFDYHAKYTPGATEEITPARFGEETNREIGDIALRVHELLGLAGMSRTDVIVRDGVPHVLEVNTIPGMTETSLLPQAAAAAGISFPQLLDRIVRAALER